MLKKTALAFCVFAAAAAAQPARVAVLEDRFPGLDHSIEQAAAAALGRQGFPATRIGIDELSSKDAFNAARFDCLVLDHSHHFPAAAKENLIAFLRDGGDLVLLGARGFLQPGSMVLPAFSNYEPYALGDVRTVETYPGQHLVGDVRIDGRFSGRSAVGMVRRAAKFIPLLEARDRYGRNRGWAAGLLVNFAEYTGSNWLLFGIDTPAFYRRPEFAPILATALRQIERPELTENAAAEQRKRLAVRIALDAPAPAGFVHRSPDGRHLLQPNGKRLFLIGANYHRSLEQAEWSAKDQPFDHLAFEDDFRKAREAGANAIRLGPASRFYDDPAIVRQCARKYGIYILVIVSWGTRQDSLANAERVAEMYKDEPMVLGYDIANEPSPGALAGLRYGGEPSPALNLFGGDLAAFNRDWSRAKDNISRGAETTFPGLGERFAVPPEYRGVTDALNDTLALWISGHVAAIRKHDRNHLVTVGYNNTLACLPASRQLDFVSHHVYDRPLSYEMVMSNLTTMDRLARLYPERPITLGEFGYSNGVVMPDGRYLGFHSSAVGEMMHYLYALAKGYDGCMKWVLADWHWDPIAKAGDRGRPTQIYEAYFGIYYYDGNPNGLGRRKPIGYAMKFLRDYLDARGVAGGAIEIRRTSGTSFGAGYVYTAKDALFVGDSAYRSPRLEFHAAQPANVMLWWEGGKLELLSTADAAVTITPSAFGVVKPHIRGKHGQVRADGGKLTIDVLEGERLVIR